MYIYYHKASGRTYRYYKGISLSQLKKKIEKKHKILIIDILDDEHFANKHIPTAQNVCYYQVDFIENFKKLIEKTEPKRIIIYGLNSRTYEAKNAYLKLSDLGFKNLAIFKGGLEEREQAGYPIEGSLDQEKSALEKIETSKNKILKIDSSKSQIQRTGKNIFKRHIGTIDIKNGLLSMKEGKPMGGNLILDMNTIQNMDIRDKTLNAILVKHLKSDDFFDVKKFPEASFDLTLAKAMKNDANYYLHGNIVIKGIKKLIRTKACVTFLKTGEINITAQFEINKVDFNILYGSSKFFGGLGKHFIHDKIGIDVNLFYK